MWHLSRRMKPLNLRSFVSILTPRNLDHARSPKGFVIEKAKYGLIFIEWAIEHEERILEYFPSFVWTPSSKAFSPGRHGWTELLFKTKRVLLNGHSKNLPFIAWHIYRLGTHARKSWLLAIVRRGRNSEFGAKKIFWPADWQLFNPMIFHLKLVRPHSQCPLQKWPNKPFNVRG